MAKLQVKWTAFDDDNNEINSGEINDIALTNDLEETLEFDTLLDIHTPTLEHVGTRPRDRE